MKSIQDAIESLHAKDLCPRLHVDVTHADAVCPDFVRDKWKEQLVIDLDPSYPLDLAFTEDGVEADLSFGGYVTRCVFPWTAIYVVADRDSGRGQVFASHIPASLRHKFGVPQAPVIDPALTEVRDDANAKRSRRRKRRGAAEPSPRGPVGVIEGASADEAEDQAEDQADRAAASAAEEPSEQTAQTRRSAFKVIDGGG
ncbi:MAG: ClpXP protease specificity-enhancing factor SspB [Enhygromyxa sp.]